MDVILDPEFFVRNRDILKHGKNDLRFLLPVDQFESVRRSFSDQQQILFNISVMSGALGVLEVPAESRLTASVKSNLDVKSARLLQGALEYAQAHGRENVYLITDNPTLKQMGTERGLQIKNALATDDIIDKPQDRSNRNITAEKITWLNIDPRFARQHPDVLDLRNADVRLMLSVDSLNELDRNPSPSTENAILAGVADGSIATLPSPPLEATKRLMGAEGVPGETAHFLLASEQFRTATNSQNIFVVTNDPQVDAFCSRNGVPIIYANSVPQVAMSLIRLVNVVPQSKDVSNSVVPISPLAKVRIFCSGAGVAIVASLLVVYRNEIFQGIGKWGVGPLALFCGYLLYLFRNWDRMAYGLAEVLFGVGAIIILGIAKQHDSAFYIQFAGSVYVVVRGLDNFDTGRVKGRRSPQWLTRPFLGG